MYKINNKLDLTKVPFEIALDKTGFGLYSYLLTLLTGVSIISYGCVVYSSTILVPISACELNTTTTQQGLLVAGPVIGSILGAVIWGYLADTQGRRIMLLASFMSSATLNAVSSISINWIMLLIVQFCTAVMAAGQYTIAMTLLSESVPALRRNLVILVVASIFLLSQGVMSLLAIPVVSLSFNIHVHGLGIFWNPWRTVILIYCIPSLICFVWMLFMKESPKYVFMKGNEEKAIRILEAIHKLNKGKSKGEFGIIGLLEENTEVAKNKQVLAGPRILELFKFPLLKFIIIMTLLSVFLVVNAFMVWLPTIANQFVVMIQNGRGRELTLCDIIAAGRNASSKSSLPQCSLNVNALLMVFGVGCFLSLFNLLLSLVINKAGRRNSAIVIALICGISGIIVNLIPNAIGSAIFFLVFLMAMVLFGIYTAISVSLFPTHLRALAVSLTLTGGRVVLFGLVQVLNYLLVNNCELGFYLFATIVTSSTIIATFLPDDRYHQKPVNSPMPIDSIEESNDVFLDNNLNIIL